MKNLFMLLLATLILFTLSACQKVVELPDTPDEIEIIENAITYFEQMRSGNFETIYNDLPEGVKKQTKSAQTIQDAWNETVEKVGGIPKESEPQVSCFYPKGSEQIRIEFIIPCKNDDFKVFINYDGNGNLYNYVIWKNN